MSMDKHFASRPSFLLTPSCPLHSDQTVPYSNFLSGEIMPEPMRRERCVCVCVCVCVREGEGGREEESAHGQSDCRGDFCEAVS